MRPNKETFNEIKDRVESLADSMSVKQIVEAIGKEFGYKPSPQSVGSWIRQADKSPRKMYDAAREVALKLRRETKLNSVRISKRLKEMGFDIAPQLISTWCRNAKMPYKGKYLPDTVIRCIQKLGKEGSTPSQIRRLIVEKYDRKPALSTIRTYMRTKEDIQKREHEYTEQKQAKAYRLRMDTDVREGVLLWGEGVTVTRGPLLPPTKKHPRPARPYRIEVLQGEYLVTRRYCGTMLEMIDFLSDEVLCAPVILLDKNGMNIDLIASSIERAAERGQYELGVAA